ncbi:hypothetical protein HNP65_001222 [Thermosipho japonicus]|uniref:Uncharacterized protein n=1 Tax=Thermosipho japonicus TaxID=90323 RepID=A0A841GTQ5_9BACT|nr:hypothetical protein [Thermosipho japonicus]MBB6062770.1 hypothetical protein [Thermosipho japonicus]
MSKIRYVRSKEIRSNPLFYGKKMKQLLLQMGSQKQLLSVSKMILKILKVL